MEASIKRDIKIELYEILKEDILMYNEELLIDYIYNNLDYYINNINSYKKALEFFINYKIKE